MKTLSLVVWNCAGAFMRKHRVAEKHDPDIAIISEVGNDVLRRKDDTTSISMAGTANGHGVAVIGFKGWVVEPASVEPEARIFHPVYARRGTESVQIVGVCAKREVDYTRPTLRAIAALQPFLMSCPTIVAGDFNQTVALDRTRRSKRGFSEVASELERLGLRSAWHHSRSEHFGSESRATYFHHWKAERPWHIDYAFVPNSMRIDSINIGAFDEIVAARISDHVPLSVSLGY